MIAVGATECGVPPRSLRAARRTDYLRRRNGVTIGGSSTLGAAVLNALNWAGFRNMTQPCGQCVLRWRSSTQVSSAARVRQTTAAPQTPLFGNRIPPSGGLDGHPAQRLLEAPRTKGAANRAGPHGLPVSWRAFVGLPLGVMRGLNHHKIRPSN